MAVHTFSPFSTYGDTGYLVQSVCSPIARHSRIEEAVKENYPGYCQYLGHEQSWSAAPEGYAADITIFDAEQIDRGEEYYVQDVPGDGSRYVRDSKGIDTVIIGGEIAYRGMANTLNPPLAQLFPGASNMPEAEPVWNKATPGRHERY